MSRRASIVLVDDSEIARANAEDILSRAGYRVRTLASPYGVSAALAGDPADLILLDVNMPGLNGDRVAEILRRHFTFSCPVLFYSDMNPKELAELVVAAGVDGFVSKSASEADLIATISRHLAAVPGAAAAPRSAEVANHRTALRLLVVDESEIVRERFRSGLMSLLSAPMRARGVEVHVAGSVFEAWEALQRIGGADLVVVDEQLRGLRGSELVRRLRRDERFRRTAIISTGRDGEPAEVLVAGANKYLQKPVPLSRLVAAVEALLGSGAAATR